jgi:hypothetical protein
MGIKVKDQLAFSLDYQTRYIKTPDQVAQLLTIELNLALSLVDRQVYLPLAQR